jgi:phosphatidylethanolamine-binding protein (PEBP) family uncharacterized protein
VTLTTQGNRLGYHWAIWNIPASTLALPEGLALGNPIASLAGAKQVSGPLFGDGYVGPCPSWAVAPGAPPPAEGAPEPEVSNDDYTFTIYALPTETISEPPEPTATAADGAPNYVHVLEFYFTENALGRAVLNATSDAQPQSFAPPPAAE